MMRAAHEFLSCVSAPLRGLARAECGRGGFVCRHRAFGFRRGRGHRSRRGQLVLDQAGHAVRRGCGAYAAALEFARQGLDEAPDLTAMQAVANDAASRNGVGVAVTLNVPPLSGPAAGDAQSVEVIVTVPAPVYFTSLFMVSGVPAPPAQGRGDRRQ
jgi:hypothetical protein